MCRKLRQKRVGRRICLLLIRMGWWYCEACGRYHSPFRLKIETENCGCVWTACLHGMRKVAVDNLGDYGTEPEEFMIWNLQEPETEAERLHLAIDKKKIIKKLERRRTRHAGR